VTAGDSSDVIVALDLFPADAALSGGTTYSNVRAVVADGVLQLWRQTSGGPVVVFQHPLTGWSGSVRTAFELATDDGVVVVGKSGGCGCGASLGNVDLFPGRRRINTTLS